MSFGVSGPSDDRVQAVENLVSELKGLLQQKGVHLSAIGSV